MPSIIILRLLEPEMGAIADALHGKPAIMGIVGARLLFRRLMITAFHQYG